MNKMSKIAAAAAGIVLASGAAAAAVTAPPEQADKGLSTAEEHTGIELPATKDSHPTKDDHPGGGAAADHAPEAAEAAEAAEGVGPVDNHGADVSAVAQDDSTTGRAHGEAVSEVARAGHGAPAGTGAPETSPAAGHAAVATPNPGGIGTANDASNGASEVGASHAAPQAAAGAANSAGHRP